MADKGAGIDFQSAVFLLKCQRYAFRNDFDGGDLFLHGNRELCRRTGIEFLNYFNRAAAVVRTAGKFADSAAKNGVGVEQMNDRAVFLFLIFDILQ